MRADQNFNSEIIQSPDSEKINRLCIFLVHFMTNDTEENWNLAQLKEESRPSEFSLKSDQNPT